MSTRIEITNNLAGGVEDLIANYQQFESDFQAFIFRFDKLCNN